MTEESLKDICKELGIKWTDNPQDIVDLINVSIDYAILKEQRKKDL